MLQLYYRGSTPLCVAFAEISMESFVHIGGVSVSGVDYFILPLQHTGIVLLFFLLFCYFFLYWKKNRG